QEETGRELRRLTGCLLMGPTEQQQMATVLQSIAEHDLDHDVLDAESLAKRFPQYRIEDGDAAVLDRRAGFIRPELTIQTAARRAEQLGAVIHRYTTVREIVPVANGVEVRTDAGSERFDTAVVTPGPWVNDLLPGLPWEVEILRVVSAWYVPTTPEAWGSARSVPRSSVRHPSTATVCPPRTASRSSSASPALCTALRATRTSWTGRCSRRSCRSMPT
ncbi:FAD-dependent oxidoreductase, partial [Streptomyces yerevanensis]|uniref:FAD-dependent oxidoreductase n=1 Tax=Streptomyces yerevanensis TaxID=66378 RepID=UPI001FE20E9B